MKAKCLSRDVSSKPKAPVIGVFSPCDPRIDKDSRKRAENIIKMTADSISGKVIMPDKTPVEVVYSDVLIDSEQQADLVANQFKDAGVNILVGCLDTWAFPQLTGITLLQHFPKETPINLTCGNSGPKPGVVFAHALNGAISQYGRLVSLNVGNWPDTGSNPQMSEKTAENLVDWCYAAVTYMGLKGRRVLAFGHDSMGMETALAHVIPTRNTFGVEIARLDMKMLADMLQKGAYDANEVKALRAWVDKMVGDRLEIKSDADSERFNLSLAMYLINRDMIKDLNAVGGGFMSQLEWGSDNRGVPLPVADFMESILNSSFDHNGQKSPVPYATENDMQGLLTMLFMTWLTGGEAPLFMDLRKVWEPWELKQLAESKGITGLPTDARWYQRGLFDGNNSGSAAFDWAGKSGDSPQELMKNVIMPLADDFYFPGGGNSVTFTSPGDIDGLTGRLTYSATSDKFGMVWDQATTAEVPEKLEKEMCNLTNWNWPHTFVVPKYATMGEFKQYAPANHIHMIQNLPVARLQYWMDMTGVLDITPWQEKPAYVEGVDRPQPLIYLMNGGESQYKMMK